MPNASNHHVNHALLPMLVAAVLIFSASVTLGGQLLPLQGTYGNASGCDRLGRDDRLSVSKDGLEGWETSCSFIDITSVADEFSDTTTLGAWSIRMVCHSEGISYPEDVLIVEGRDMDGKQTLVLSYSVDDQNTLHLCK